MIDVLQLARKAAEGRHAVSEGDAHSLRFDELERFSALVLEEAAKEFDRRMVLDKFGFAVGFYEPEEPAQIIRSLKPNTEGQRAP